MQRGILRYVCQHFVSASLSLPSVPTLISYTQSPSTMLGVMLALSLIVFFPLFVDPLDSYDDKSIGITLQNSSVFTFAIIVVTTNVPLFMYLILDFLYFGRNDHRLPRFAIVFISFTSFLLLFCSQYFTEGKCLFVCIYYWQIWIWASASFLSLSYYDDTANKIFATWKMTLITVCFSAARVFQLYTLNRENHTISLLESLSYYASTFGLVTVTLQWKYHLFKKWRQLQNLEHTFLGLRFLTENDISLTLVLWSIIAITLFWGVLAEYTQIYSANFFYAYYVLAVIYSSCLFTYFNFVDQANQIRLKQTLETKKTFVRYVSHEIR